ncbi:hypothetical protein F4808DRAFT_465248 [Astrocystis sublimbata]|nr:hypothetical protein F4808DRAFT_465248 [Astrocystis sublimbata]
MKFISIILSLAALAAAAPKAAPAAVPVNIKPRTIYEGFCHPNERANGQCYYRLTGDPKTSTCDCPAGDQRVRFDFLGIMSVKLKAQTARTNEKL